MKGWGAIATCRFPCFLVLQLVVVVRATAGEVSRRGAIQVRGRCESSSRVAILAIIVNTCARTYQ